MAFLYLILLISLSKQVFGGFYGLTYSPYSTMGVCRSPEELEEDVALMLEHTSRIRLYSTECPEVMNALLTKASNGQLSLLLGVWIENSPRDQKEIGMLLEYLSQYPHAQLDGIVIGNEVLFRGQASAEYMAALVVDTRNKIRGVGYEFGSYMLQNVQVFSVEESPNQIVASVSDCVGVNIHPYYDWTLSTLSDPKEMGIGAAERFKLKLDYHRSQFPANRIIVAEVGWPSNSDQYSGDSQIGSDLLQMYFVQAFLEIVASDPVPYYFFEFRNADWKRHAGNFKSGAYSEFNFGLFDSQGHPKMALQN